ncbi:AAA family ATPase [Psychromonas aquimarina]|uniref:AAA family ATPase n=1 Tax=Psychromonas aquimarina TaxID=444919 RepID=UPI0003FFB773|nr:ATP-binding protein [Psychromonas aquimarina]
MNKLQLTLIRGLPGSGKSTLAKTINAVHLEADMYFIQADGGYLFDPVLLKEAHQWCQEQCRVHLEQGKNVVVANTFVRHWEIQPYRQLAEETKARLIIKTCRGNYANIHGVSQQTINKMKRNWQV